MGQNYQMTLKIMQVKNGTEEERVVTVKLPLNADGVIVNIPGVLAGLPADAYLEEFVPVVVQEPADDTVNTGDTGDDLMGGM